jgi:tetratricopeptide (TPR) repeat protein
MNRSETLSQLVFTLENRLTPSLYFVCCSTESIEEKIKQTITAQLSQYKHFTVDLTPHKVTSLYEAIKSVLPPEILNSKSLEYIVHVKGLETNLFNGSAEGKVLETKLPEEMNFERELLFNGFPFITIIWSTKYFYSQLFKRAPDLVNWLVNYFEFSPEGEADSPIVELPYTEQIPVRGATSERKERIEQLTYLLQRLDRENPDQQKIIKEKISAFLLLGKEYLEIYHWDKSVEVLEIAIVLAEQIGDNRSIAEINFELGNAFISSRDWDNASQSYLKALNLLIALNDKANYGTVYHQLGYVFAEQRKWEDAIGYYQKALEWKEKTKNEFELGGTYHQLGRVYEEQRKWEDAIGYYRKALEWKEKTRNEFALGNTYHQLGMVYEEQQKWEDAIGYYQKALYWKEKTKNEFELGSTYHQLGRVYEQRGLLLEAKNYYCLSIELLERVDSENLNIAQRSLERVEHLLNNNKEESL